MKKLAATLFAAILTAAFAVSPALAQINLVSTTGTEGGTNVSDSTPMGIDNSGFAFNDTDPFNLNQDFTVTGSVANPDAWNTDFDFRIQAMDDVNTTTGASLADGVIDRDSAGRLGVRGDTGGNGIDPLEGFLLGIDARELNPALRFQITGVDVAFLADPDFGQVINRSNSSQSLSFGGVGTGADVELGSGTIDVSSLDLSVSGGAIDNEIASIFGTVGGFRFTGFTLDVAPETKIVLQSLASGSEGDTRFTDSTPIGVDGAGAAFDPNAGNGFEDFAVAGVIPDTGAYSTNFNFHLAGMSDVNLTTGEKIADGGIDRDSQGRLGVRGGTGSGLEQGEGFLLGVNAQSLDPLLAYRITDVGVTSLGDSEAGVIINRNNTANSLSFGAPGTGSDWEGTTGFVDVSSLGLTIDGGYNLAEVASVFGSAFGTGNFRLTGFKLDVVDADMSKIFFDPLGSGSESDMTFTDSTPFSIDGTGTAFTTQQGSTSQDFAVQGSTAEADAFNTNFQFIMTGMSDVNVTTGEKLADGGIDRAGNGDLGIRGGTGNGIDQLEGYLLGFDATDLDPSLAVQITDIKVDFLGEDETGKIVNRNDPSKSLTFGASGTGSDIELSEGFIDVTDLDLFVRGGLFDEEVASLFALDYVGTSGFRVTYFKFDIVEAVQVTGDYNGDGLVNAADYTVWRDTEGNSVTPGTGADGNNNGIIDAADYIVWQLNFGNSASTSSAAAVPEPASMIIVLAAAGVSLAISGRRN